MMCCTFFPFPFWSIRSVAESLCGRLLSLGEMQQREPEESEQQTPTTHITYSLAEVQKFLIPKSTRKKRRQNSSFFLYFFLLLLFTG